MKLPKKKPNMDIELAKLEAKAADYRTEFYTFFSLVLSFGVTVFIGFSAYAITLATTSPSTGFQFFVSGSFIYAMWIIVAVWIEKRYGKRKIEISKDFKDIENGKRIKY
jgi:lipopolysaccharide export LptBFGC system permease protein LptF